MKKNHERGGFYEGGNDYVPVFMSVWAGRDAHSCEWKMSLRDRTRRDKMCNPLKTEGQGS